MSDDITIDVGMDPSAYLSGSQQIQAANAGMVASFGQITGTSGMVGRALSLITPGRAALAGWSAMAYQSGQVQQSLGGLRAISTVTGVDVGKLTTSMHNLAREFPVGNSGAQALVTQFTQMGIQGAGTEAKINALAKSTASFSSATGAGLGEAATSLSDFARATGNTNLNLKPFNDLRDSVTQVAASTGSSASSVLNFGKMIAPMASQAGVGGAAITGISGAFTRLGEDGIGATTAVNKMFSDMSKSVRDGTPDLAVYSQAVGKTTKEFTALYKANPAEALTQVTEAIAKSSTGPRLLERLGLDSVRTMKSLTALSASGGLRPAIAAGIAGYGSGITDKASASANAGLLNASDELQSSLGQLSNAMGAPLLGPLTLFTKALSKPLGGLATLANSDFVQKTVTGLAYTAMGGSALLAMKGIPKILGSFGMGRQMVTSMPVSAAALGYSDTARLQPDSRISRQGEQARIMTAPDKVTPLMPRGWLGVGMSGPASIKAEEIGRGQGSAAFQKRTVGWLGGTRGLSYLAGGGDSSLGAAGERMYQEETGAYMAKGLRLPGGAAEPQVPGRAAMGWARFKGYGLTAATLLPRISAAQMNQANLAASERPTVTGYSKEEDAARTQTRAENKAFTKAGMIGPLQDERARPEGVVGMTRAGKDAGAAMVKGFSAAGGGMGGILPGLKAMDAQIVAGALGRKASVAADGEAVKATRFLAGAMETAGASIKAQAGLFRMGAKDASAAVGVAGKAGKFGSGMLGLLGGAPGIALMGGLALGTKIYSDQKEEAAKKIADKAAWDSSDINGVINKYRESEGLAAKNSIAQTAVASGKSAAPTPTVASVLGAVTPEEQAAAQSGKVLHPLAGRSDKEIVAQAKTISPGGYSPSELSAMRKDWLRQGVAAADIPLITGELNKTKGMILGPDQIGDRTPTTAGASLMPKGTGTALGAKLLPSNQVGKGGAKYAAIPLTDAQQGYIQDVISGIGQQKVAEEGRAGPVAAAQGHYRAATATYNEMKDAGASPRALADFSTKMLTQLNPQGKKNFAINNDEQNKYGSNFAEIIAARDPKGTFAQELKSFKAQGLSTAATGGVTGTTLPGAVSNMLDAAGDKFGANLFSNTNTGKFAKAIADAALVPGDAARQQKLVQATLADAAGGSGGASPAGQVAFLGDKIAELNTTIGHLSPGDQQSAAITARDALVQQQGFQSQGLTSTQQQTQRIAGFGAAADIQINAGTDQSIVDAQKAGKAGLQNEQGLIIARAQARLEVQRQYEKTVARSTTAFNLSQVYTAQDYSRAIERTDYSTNLSATRAREEYQISTRYATADYNKSRWRTQRDFNISQDRAQYEFNKSKLRSERDYQISLKRSIEDAAKTMYDPYSRIQTKATWDMDNLLSNMRQQNEAMVKQKSDLDTLRKRGLSQQAIDQLSLGKTENAQQVNNLIDDTKSRPSGIAEMNKQAAEREKAASALVMDKSNVDITRGAQDFAKGQKDSLKDNKDRIRFAVADLKRGFGDMAFEFDKSIARGKASLDRSLKLLAIDAARALLLMAEDNARGNERARAANKLNLSNMAIDIKDADITITSDIVKLQAGLTKALAGKSGSLKGLLINDMSEFAKAMGTNVATIQADLAAVGVNLVHVTNPAAKQTSAQRKGNDRQGAAEGGTINGYSPHSKADNILIRATAGEFMQPVDVVQHYGVGTMEKMRTKSIPKKVFDKYEGFADGGWVGMWDWAHKKFPGTQKTSDFRPGGNSYHARGSAIDLAPPNIGIFNTIAATFGNKIAELIYTPAADHQIKDGHAVPASFYAEVAAAHYNHVHWAMPPNAGGTAPGTGAPISGATASGTSSYVLSAKALFKGMEKWTGGLKKKIYLGALAAFNKDYPAGKTFAGATDSAAPASGPTTSNANATLGAAMAKAKYGWSGAQGRSLNTLWTGESGWNNNAQNPTSTAYGIAQFLDSTWAGYGGPKTADPALQIKYGLNYIEKRYGDPSSALAKWQARSPHWYDQGGKVKPGTTLVHNGTGQPEALLNPKQWELVSGLLSREQGKDLNASSGVHMTVNHHESITYDNRNDFGGARITVQSQDPDDMARQLQAKVTRSRVTQTRGVRPR